MDKKWSILFTILLGMVGSRAFAYDFEVKNADGISIYYNYIKEGTELEVTNGDYSGIVNIPEDVTYMNRTRKVTSIGNYAFSECINLKSVTISNSVTIIHDFAFYKCKNLNSVTIGNGVTYIGGFAFFYCTSLPSITIPNSVTGIGWGAFDGCNNLVSVTIPNSVTYIEGQAFKDCHRLTSISIPNSVNRIGESAFCNCYDLSSVTISNNVTFLPQQLFEGCRKLTSISIPNSVANIGHSAFKDSDLTSVLSYIDNPNKIYGVTSDNRVFSKNTFYNATLYVPKGAIDKYKSCEGWRDFMFIEEGLPSNILNLKSINEKAQKYYEMDGKNVTAPLKGINIVKYDNGSTKKVIIK